MIGNFVTKDHAVVVVGYYASKMCEEARVLWKANKEQFIKAFEGKQKEVEILDRFFVEGVKMEALYDITYAKAIMNTIFELGQYIEELSTGENHKQAPEGGEDFGFYLVECSMALYSGLGLIEELDPLEEYSRSYLRDLYQAL